jgi:hypothetical protein
MICCGPRGGAVEEGRCVSPAGQFLGQIAQKRASWSWEEISNAGELGRNLFFGDFFPSWRLYIYNKGGGHTKLPRIDIPVWLVLHISDNHTTAWTSIPIHVKSCQQLGPQKFAG